MTHRTDTDRALLHADPLPYADGADRHDIDLAHDADDRAREHAGQEEAPMIDLGKIPVGLTVTADDAEILIAALLHFDGADTQRRLMLLGHVSNCLDASMDKHRAAGVPARPVQAIRRVSEMETVLPLRPDNAA